MLRVWAIADLHLSFAAPKPMDIFGSHWHDHPRRIREACNKVIDPDDLLLLPGDLSWAMKRADANLDLEYIASLPGRKVLAKGNHDYWWDSDKALGCAALDDTPFATANRLVGVAGIRGWTPLHADLTPQERDSSAKIIAKEVRRLDKRLAAIADCSHIYAMIHYPPIADFLPVLQAYRVEMVLYGHLHLGGSDSPLPEQWCGMRCYCVAADRLGFKPKLVATIDS